MRNSINSKNVCTFILTGTLLSSSLLFSGHALANKDKEKKLEQLIIEWEEAGIDSNHSETIEKILDYVDNNVEQGTFASLHIDREDQPLGIIVVSFTNEISLDMQNEIKALVEAPADVSFRVVKYTEEQLMEKQREIDSAIFEKEVFKNEGITVQHTGTDIINNKVEIGIFPFNENSNHIVKDYFKNDMISVVEGQQVQLLSNDIKQETQNIDNTITSTSAESDNQKTGFFVNVWNWIVSWFK